MHWGIFIGKREKPSGNIPYTGTLFHASGACVACLGPCGSPLDKTTNYRLERNFHPIECSTFHDYLLLTNSSVVGVEAVIDSCDRVTEGRDWNMITANCQVWATQVLSDMVKNGRLPNTIWEEMKVNDWKTIPDLSTEKCCNPCDVCVSV